MEIYATEEEQIIAFKNWWKANKKSIISGIIMAIIIIAGWSLWQRFQQDKMSQASALYEQLITAEKASKFELVDKISNKLNSDYGSTTYATYALLFAAKVKVKEQNLIAAKEQLQQAIVNNNDATLMHLARTRLIRVLLALQQYEQGLKMIADTDKSSLAGFGAIYAELKGDLYIGMGRLGEARTAYQAALFDGQASPLLQLKLDDLTIAN